MLLVLIFELEKMGGVFSCHLFLYVFSLFYGSLCYDAVVIIWYKTCSIPNKMILGS